MIANLYTRENNAHGDSAEGLLSIAMRRKNGAESNIGHPLLRFRIFFCI